MTSIINLTEKIELGLLKRFSTINPIIFKQNSDIVSIKFRDLRMSSELCNEIYIYLKKYGSVIGPLDVERAVIFLLELSPFS